MNFDQNDECDDADSSGFAVSESSAEFFFSRRASMDELSEPGISAELSLRNNSTVVSTEGKIIGNTSVEFAERNVAIWPGDEAGERQREGGGTETTVVRPQQQNNHLKLQCNYSNHLTVGRETPRASRKRRDGEGNGRVLEQQKVREPT